MEGAAKQQGADITDPAIATEIQKQSFQMLIDNTLLLTAAKDSGATATQAEIDKTYAGLVEQMGGEDKITEQLITLGITLEELKSNIRDRIIVDSYIASVSDASTLKVSDDEIKTFYAGLPSDKVPPLAQIKTQIETQLAGQKKQEALKKIIADLHTKAKIEEKI